MLGFQDSGQKSEQNSLKIDNITKAKPNMAVKLNHGLKMNNSLRLLLLQCVQPAKKEFGHIVGSLHSLFPMKLTYIEEGLMHGGALQEDVWLDDWELHDVGLHTVS